MSFISLDLLTTALVAKLASADDLVLLDLRKAWRDGFPESISSHAYLQSLASGILTIAVDSPVRQREFGFLSGEIRAKLAERVPRAAGLELRFRTARPFVLPRPRTSPVAIPDETRARLEEKARGIVSRFEEPRQREAAYQFVLSRLEEGAALGYGETGTSAKKRPKE